MATSVFKLFGTLGIDPKDFQRGLRGAEGELQGFTKKVELTEKQQQKLFQQSALLQQKLASQTTNLKERLAQQQAQFAQRLEVQKQRLTQQSEQFQQRQAQITNQARERLSQQAAQFVIRQNSLVERSEQSNAARRLAVLERAKASRERLAQAATQFEIRQAERAASAFERAQARASAAAERAQAKIKAAAERAASASRQSWSRAWQGIGEAAQTASNYASIAITAIGAASIKSASSLDDLKNKLTAATGTISGANAKIDKFRKMDAPGVMTSFAAETYAFLKPMKLGERTIESFTRALGRVKLRTPDLDAFEFSRNLTQLFTQNFELEDLKQLVGKFPEVAPLLAKKFGFKGSDLGALKEGFQGLKAAGKLSLESFIEGFSDAVENDTSLGLLRDTISIRMAKVFEKLSFAVAPLGNAILEAFEPFIPPLIAILERLSEKFTALSPTIRSLIVGAGAFGAALAPIIGIGKLIAPIISGIIALINAPLLAAIGAIAAAATALYVSWRTNFGGIQEYTSRVWEFLKTTIGGAMSFIYNNVVQLGSGIVGWFQDNWGLISQTVKTVSDTVKSVTQGFLNTVAGFWASHGAAITSYAKSAYETIKGVLTTVYQQIGALVETLMNVINGDWGSAWNSFLEFVKYNIEGVTRLLFGFGKTIEKALEFVIPLVVDWGLRFVTKLGEWSTKAVKAVVYILATLPEQLAKLFPVLINAGIQLGAAIQEGVLRGLAGGTAEPTFEMPKFKMPNLNDFLFGTPEEQAKKAARDAAQAYSDAFAMSLEDKYKPALAATTDLTKEELKALKEQSKERDKQNKLLEEQAKKLRENLATVRAAIFESASQTTNNPFVKLFEDGRLAAQKMIETTQGLSKEIKAAAIEASAAQFGGGLFQQRITNQLDAFNLRQTAEKFRNAIPADWQKMTNQERFENFKMNESLRKQIALIKSASDSFMFGGKGQKLSAEQRQKIITDNLARLFQNVDPSRLDFGLAQQAAKVFENQAVNRLSEENRAEEFYKNMNGLINDKGLLIRGATMQNTINAYGGATFDTGQTRPSQDKTSSTR